MMFVNQSPALSSPVYPNGRSWAQALCPNPTADAEGLDHGPLSMTAGSPAACVALSYICRVAMLDHLRQGLATLGRAVGLCHGGGKSAPSCRCRHREQRWYWVPVVSCSLK
jgi:hypothetical protein